MLEWFYTSWRWSSCLYLLFHTVVILVDYSIIVLLHVDSGVVLSLSFLFCSGVLSLFSVILPFCCLKCCFLFLFLLLLLFCSFACILLLFYCCLIVKFCHYFFLLYFCCVIAMLLLFLHVVVLLWYTVVALLLLLTLLFGVFSVLFLRVSDLLLLSSNIQCFSCICSHYSFVAFAIFYFTFSFYAADCRLHAFVPWCWMEKNNLPIPTVEI